MTDDEIRLCDALFEVWEEAVELECDWEWWERGREVARAGLKGHRRRVERRERGEGRGREERRDERAERRRADRQDDLHPPAVFVL